MIEIIRQEEHTQPGIDVLPKDIRQIGTPEVGDRIYVEQKTYEALHAGGDGTRKTYALLGRMEHYAGRDCVFVEAAIAVEEMSYQNGIPTWEDHCWGNLYRKLRREHEHMVIVGWAHDIGGHYPLGAEQMEQVHREHFNGVHQVFLLMDSTEGEETFFGNRNDRLVKREGFYLYRNHRRAPEHPVGSAGQQSLCELPEMPRETYRRTRKSRRKRSAHALPYVAALALFVLLGAVAYRNQQRVNEMQEVLAHLYTTNSTDVETDETADRVQIETVAGGIEKETEAAETMAGVENGEADNNSEAVADSAADGAGDETETGETEEPVDAAATDAPVVDAAVDEAQQYLAQGYYVVQQGDNLAGICRKIYRTTALMATICELNGIENEDAIYAGQHLTLPN